MNAEAGKCLLIVVLVLGTITGQWGAATLASDANNDSRFDIRDLQLVLFQIMHASAPDSRADVNADGAVNVLDMQRLLSQAHRNDLPVLPTHSNDAPCATLLSRANLIVACDLPRRTSIIETTGAPQRGQYTGPYTTVPALVKTVRYSFYLISNAPPEQA